jgi:hypothetical protein
MRGLKELTGINNTKKLVFFPPRKKKRQEKEKEKEKEKKASFESTTYTAAAAEGWIGGRLLSLNKYRERMDDLMAAAAAAARWSGQVAFTLTLQRLARVRRWMTSCIHACTHGTVAPAMDGLVFSLVFFLVYYFAPFFFLRFDSSRTN